MNKASKGSKGKGEEALFDALTCTSVQVYPCKESSGKTKAFARVAINDQLQLTGLRVVDGANGFFVSYPLDPYNKAEEYHSIYYPINKELRDHVEQCVLEKYQDSVAGA
jgi:stage V sporulation protein G